MILAKVVYSTWIFFRRNFTILVLTLEVFVCHLSKKPCQTIKRGTPSLLHNRLSNGLVLLNSLAGLPVLPVPAHTLPESAACLPFPVPHRTRRFSPAEQSQAGNKTRPRSSRSSPLPSPLSAAQVGGFCSPVSLTAYKARTPPSSLHSETTGHWEHTPLHSKKP